MHHSIQNDALGFPQGSEAGSIKTDIADCLARARSAFDVGNLAEVHAQCQKVLAVDRGHVDAHLLLGIALAKGGQLAASESALQYVISQDPSSAMANYWFALVLRQSGDLKRASIFAQISVDLDPTQPEALAGLASIQLTLSELIAALKTIQRAIEVLPTRAAYHHTYGIILYRLRRLNEAADAFNEARALNPMVSAPYVNLAQTYRDLQRTDLADQCLIQAQKAFGNNSSLLFELAVRLMTEGLYAEAVKVGRVLLALEPANAQAMTLVGKALKKLGKFEDAVAILERAVQLRPQAMNAHVDILSCRKATQADLPMLKLLEGAVANPALPKEGFTSIHYSLGRAYDQLGDYEIAMGHFEAANAAAFESMGSTRLDLAQHRTYVTNSIRLFSKEFVADRRREPTNGPTPIIVVGMIRSGTTLLEQILSSHPDIAAGGEIDYLTRQAWSFVDFYEPSIRMNRAREYAQGYEDILRARAEGNLYITDKMPNNFLVLGLVSRLFPNAKIIHCRRNPLDTCVSIFTTEFEERLNFAHDRKLIVGWYKEYLRLMDHWRAVLPEDQFLEVDYEELVADREPVIRRVLDHCEASWHPACLEHQTNTQPIRTPSWWQARQPIYSTSVGRWKNYEPWLGAFRELIPA